MRTNNILFKSLAALALSAAPTPAHSSPDFTIAGDAIIVPGYGEVVVEPDLARVSMTVNTRAKTVKEAQAANAAASKQLTDALKERFQLDKEDLITTDYSVYPEYDQSGVQVGYAVRHSLLVTLRDITHLGELLDLAGDAGATTLGSVAYGTSKQKELQLRALALAVADARVKADVIAEATGRPIVRVVKVSQGGYGFEGKEQSADEVRAATEIFPGQIVISSSVVVEYEI